MFQGRSSKTRLLPLFEPTHVNLLLLQLFLPLSFFVLPSPLGLLREIATRAYGKSSGALKSTTKPGRG